MSIRKSRPARFENAIAVAGFSMVVFVIAAFIHSYYVCHNTHSYSSYDSSLDESN